MSDELLLEDMRNSVLAEIGADTVEVVVKHPRIQLVVELGSVLSFDFLLCLESLRLV